MGLNCTAWAAAVDQLDSLPDTAGALFHFAKAELVHKVSHVPLQLPIATLEVKGCGVPACIHVSRGCAATPQKETVIAVQDTCRTLPDVFKAEREVRVLFGWLFGWRQREQAAHWGLGADMSVCGL